ncbi:TraX family protein [Ligilactobacillus apodemi]|nr:TraX family protein [Ligilactobacillus apodemi]
MNLVKKGLTGYQLKVLAMFFMLVDHVNTYLGAQMHWPLWVNFLGRFVAPTFSFLLVEGYFHTRNKRKYLNRLLLGAAVVGVGNIIYNLLTKDYINPITHQPNYYLFLGPHNIFLTLAMQLIMMWSLDNILKKHKRPLSSVTFVLSSLLMFLFLEGGMYLYPLALIFFIGRKYGKKNPMLLATAIWCLLLLLKAWMNYSSGATASASLYEYLSYDSEFMMIAVVPLIWLYNGKRGGNGSKAEKYFFYYFYPIHLWIIYLIKAFV